MRDLILTLIIFGSLPLILRRPYVGVLVWSWVGYMNPHRLTWGFAYNFPFAQVVAIFTFVGLIFSSEPKRIPWTSTTVIWVLFVIWVCITTVMALDPSHSIEKWEQTMKIQLIILVTMMTMRSREKLHMLIWVIVISIGFYGVKGGLFTLLTGGNYLVWGPWGTHIGGNNEIAFALIMIVPLLWYLQLNSKNKWIRWSILVSMLLITASIVGSYSRGAFLAGAAMGFTLILKSKRKWLLTVITVSSVVMILSFMPDKWMQRMDTIRTYNQDESAMARINSWQFAINLANDRPIVGGGFDTFTPELFSRYAPNPEIVFDSHSIYFGVLAEHGYVGLMLFILLGILTFRSGSWIIKNTSEYSEMRWAHDLAAMIQVSIVGYAIGGAFLGLAFFDLPYHLMSILLLTRSLVEQHKSSEMSENTVLASDYDRMRINLNIEDEKNKHFTID